METPPQKKRGRPKRVIEEKKESNSEISIKISKKKVSLDTDNKDKIKPIKLIKQVKNTEKEIVKHNSKTKTQNTKSQDNLKNKILKQVDKKNKQNTENQQKMDILARNFLECKNKFITKRYHKVIVNWFYYEFDNLICLSYNGDKFYKYSYLDKINKDIEYDCLVKDSNIIYEYSEIYSKNLQLLQQIADILGRHTFLSNITIGWVFESPKLFIKFTIDTYKLHNSEKTISIQYKINEFDLVTEQISIYELIQFITHHKEEIQMYKNKYKNEESNLIDSIDKIQLNSKNNINNNVSVVKSTNFVKKEKYSDIGKEYKRLFIKSNKKQRLERQGCKSIHEFFPMVITE